MSSGQGQRSGLSKAANSSSIVSTAAAHSAPVDVSGQRRAAASPAAIQASRNVPSPRNNQARKSQHKRHRRPQLVDEDTVAESFAMRSTTSRKGQTSITHLMNFSLPPRPHYQPHSSNRGNRRTANWGGRSSYHTVDKARYVHANYRFIVHPQRNYHAQATNADVHLDWDAVLQVLASAITQETNCPICLCSPVAARMAKCGHIFCLPCLIRYMHSTDDTTPTPEKRPRWKKCPICWDSIYISETRPVGWYTGQQTEPLFEGGDVVLRLVSRRPGSTLAMPRDAAVHLTTDDDVPWHHVADVPDYARIMKGSEKYMMSHFDAEIEALKKQEQEDELFFGEDTKWTQKAIASICDAKEKIKGIGNPPDLAAEPVQPRPSQSTIKFEQPGEGVPDMYKIRHALKSGQSSGSGRSPHPSLEPTDSGMDQKNSAVNADNMSSVLSEMTMDDGKASMASVKDKSASHPHPPDKPYYFYQALPHFYLSPLDIRILKAAFGDFSQFPSTILPRIEHISTGHIVDDELRKRTKYLSHLPYGCEVSFLECDWTDLVSPSVLEKFSTEINRRRKRNMEKAAREEKESMRAEKEEEKRWALARRRRSSLTGLTDASDRPFSESDFQPLGGEPVDTRIPSTSPPRGGGQSFAPIASPSNSPPSQRTTVWGTAAVPSISEPPRPPPPKDDGWLRGWEEEFYAEQHGLSLSGGNGSGTSHSSGKKKKSKKITLMSTTARRAA
ncbi:hypothetical protein VTO42DRAFT_5187 [Malbranchea cinnamomea]